MWPSIYSTKTASYSLYRSFGAKALVMNYILIHLSSVCRWWWRSWGGVHGICDGNQEDMIRGCTHNTLQCALLEVLTLGGQVESGRTGEEEWGQRWC